MHGIPLKVLKTKKLEKIKILWQLIKKLYSISFIQLLEIINLEKHQLHLNLLNKEASILKYIYLNKILHMVNQTIVKIQ